MSENSRPEYPCPSCGFLMFDEPPGSYVICEICNWEDDGVQLRFPASGGGANRKSLCEYQQIWIKKIPLEITECKGYTRAGNWRPFSIEECAGSQNFDFREEGLPSSPPYYWER